MHRKSIILFLIFLGVMAGLFGYATGLKDWIQAYSRDDNVYELIRNGAGTVALLVYTYFGIRFFNHRINTTR